ncbi:MAG: hypothetical protein ACI4PI_00845 [Oscillospiraceae bacterium]
MLNKSINHFVVKMLIVSIISTGANFYKVGAGCCFSRPSGDKQSEEKQPLVRGDSLASYTESNQTEATNASAAAANIIKNIQLAQKKVAEKQLSAAKSALTTASIEFHNNEALFVRYPGVFVQEDIDPEHNYTNLQSVRESLLRLNRTIEAQEQAKHKKAMADKFYNDIRSRIARLNMVTDDLETAGKQYEEINTLLNTQGGNVLEEGQVTNLRQQLEAVHTQLTKAQQEKEAARIKAETERKAKLEEEARIKAEQERKAKLEAEARVKAEREKQVKISQVEQTIKQINSNIAQLETVVQAIEQEITTASLDFTLDGSKNRTFETLKANITPQLSTLQTQIENLPEEDQKHYSDQMQSLSDRFNSATSAYVKLTADEITDGLTDDIDSALDNLDF